MQANELKVGDVFYTWYQEDESEKILWEPCAWVAYCPYEKTLIVQSNIAFIFS